MNTEQLLQLKAMSYDERVAKYKPLRNAGRVSLKEYAHIIYSIPYTKIDEESGDMGADIRESWNRDDGTNGGGQVCDGVSGTGCE